jgi:hypothetical protein
MNEDFAGCSLADVLERHEKGKIWHRAALEWLNVSNLDDLVEIMHVNGRLMPGHRRGCQPGSAEGVIMPMTSLAMTGLAHDRSCP